MINNVQGLLVRSMLVLNVNPEALFKGLNWPAWSVFIHTYVVTTALTAIVKIKGIYEQLNQISRKHQYRKR